MIQTGIKGEKELVVTKANTAKAMGSGTLDVFATPAMIAMMENTAYESVAAELEEGSGTVGTALNVKHVAATPVGMKVVCETELVKVDGRALTFSVKAYDETGLIGEGEHERFIVYNEKFQAKADAKLKK
ncbi:MAG: thioesterase family protein [Lachnospiraceae bacterium]|nr:thioesterase family protein [Agathobacter sp.]MDD6291254.1 thioesterase family protein [Lachnospiraceae bacterium]